MDTVPDLRAAGPRALAAAQHPCHHPPRAIAAKAEMARDDRGADAGSAFRVGQGAGNRSEDGNRGRTSAQREPEASLRSSFHRLERLRAESAGHIMLAINDAFPVESDVVRLLDRVGARLTSALAGAIGGRLSVLVESTASEVVLDIGSARPGSWTRALQRAEFDNLLADVSSAVARLRGTLTITDESFGRLRATVRIERGRASGFQPSNRDCRMRCICGEDRT
jgi:hypothetical protein